jgi:hypothetical protein
MGVVAYALRAAICRTLRGATAAGDNVFDSPMEPLDNVIGDKAAGAPVIAVFVSEMKKQNITGRNLAATQAEAEVTIQVYAPAAEFTLEVEGPDGEPIEVRVGGEGIALALDFIERQIDMAFTMADGPWGSLLRRLITSYSNVHSMRIMVRVGEAQNGTNVPMAELTYTCKTVFEPDFGKVATGLWEEVHTAFAADPDYAGIAGMLKALIEGPRELSDWRVLQGMLAATYGQMTNVLTFDPGGPPEPAQQIVIEQDP